MNGGRTEWPFRALASHDGIFPETMWIADETAMT